MFLKQEFNLIITIVDRGFSDPVIKAAKSAGAEGATIITARGAGIHETDTFMGVAIQPEKEVVMTLVKKLIRKKVMREICKSCGLTDEGKGMCFSLPVDEIGGISHLMALAKKRKTIDKKESTQSKKQVNAKVEKKDEQKEQTKTEDVKSIEIKEKKQEDTNTEQKEKITKNLTKNDENSQK